MGSGNREIASVLSKVLKIMIFSEISAVGKDFNGNFIVAFDHHPSNDEFVEPLRMRINCFNDTARDGSFASECFWRSVEIWSDRG